RLEAVHLLADDIGELADGAFEQRGLLHERDPHFLVSVGAHQLAHLVLQVLPRTDFGGQNVIHAPDWLDLFRQDQPPSAAERTRVARPERLIVTCALPSGCASLSIEVLRPLTSTLTPAALPSTTRRGAVPVTVFTELALPTS